MCARDYEDGQLCLLNYVPLTLVCGGGEYVVWCPYRRVVSAGPLFIHSILSSLAAAVVAHSLTRSCVVWGCLVRAVRPMARAPARTGSGTQPLKADCLTALMYGSHLMLLPLPFLCPLYCISFPPVC